MRSDRYTKVVLTVIAIGLWALTMTQLETPEVHAAPKPGVSIDTEYQRPQIGPHFIPTHPGPLRWQVSFANERNFDGSSTAECHTAIVVRNTTPSNVEVEVGFFHEDTSPLGSTTTTMAPYQVEVIGTRTSGQVHTDRPFRQSINVTTGSFDRGFVDVWADDPRIMVAGFLSCRVDPASGSAIPTSMVGLPAYPVGATAEYFVAGMPATWTPPIAVPELPE